VDTSPVAARGRRGDRLRVTGRSAGTLAEAVAAPGADRATEAAGRITGRTLVVDGGLSPDAGLGRGHGLSVADGTFGGTTHRVPPEVHDVTGILPDSWQPVLGEELNQPYFKELTEFVEEERARGPVDPPREEVFAALEATPFEEVKVLVLGQDPYHGEGQGHGLCFSVRPGVRIPPSLRNIYKEMRDELGHPLPDNGYLMPWARQGVLLLNAVLTVRAAEANSHQGKGWERFTDAVITAVAARAEPAVFVLWGAYARKKLRLIDTERHTVVEGAHPSPLSARKFFGSRPFGQINDAIAAHGHPPVDWRIPDLGE
jgi:uracil-DNA glycosylase